MASREAWEAMADRLYAKGVDVFDGTDFALPDEGARDPRVVALAILARTLNAMRATNLLLQDEFVVEARTLTRSILENLFFSAALAKKGEAFVTELELDDITIRRRRAKGLMEFLAKRDGQSEQHARLEAYRNQLWEAHGNTAEIQMANAALAGGVSDAFIAYRELSTDSAHPSAASLSLHIISSDDPDEPPFTISASPMLGVGDAIDTVELLCMAVLGVIVSVNEILGGVDVGERLDQLANDYAALSASKAAAQNAGASGPERQA